MRSEIIRCPQCLGRRGVWHDRLIGGYNWIRCSACHGEGEIAKEKNAAPELHAPPMNEAWSCSQCGRVYSADDLFCSECLPPRDPLDFTA